LSPPHLVIFENMRRILIHPRPLRPGIFRRRMILQLTSLLDLMLILVFVQYLEMQQVSARAIGEQTQRRQAAEAQRDLLLSNAGHNLYEVWQIHLNGNKSEYPDGSILLSTATVKQLIQPRDQNDFVQRLIDATKFSPRPQSPCILLLTWGDVRRDALEQVRGELRAAAEGGQLSNVWGGEPVRFEVVEGGLLETAK
jgi:hypothetical protein